MGVILARSQKPRNVRWVLGLACAGIVFANGKLRAGSEEPECRGHALSYWLEHYITRTTDEDRAQAKEAEVAIREIGTNAIPALLAWLRYEPSQTKTDILNFLARLRKSSYGRWVPAALTHDYTHVPPANVGFYVLGPSAAEAIPELERMANDAAHKIPAARAMMALSAIGPAALPAVEARLSNTNFPFPPDAAVRMYVRTRTLLDEHSVSAVMAKPILEELRTNKNPILVEGANQMLKEMESPSRLERKQTKSLSEALADLRMEREMGPLKPGWNLPPVATRSNRIVASVTNLATGSVMPTMPHGDEPYPYPLIPGSQAWIEADVRERIESTKIPKEWRDHATSWQMFRSAIAHPYFRVIYVSGYNMADCYRASRNGTVSILRDVDTAPEFGTNVLRWLAGLDLAKMVASACSGPDEPCFMDYRIVCYMAGMDSALESLDLDSRQKLFRLAVWDADYLLSESETGIANCPISLMYVIYNKPETFRGTFPAGFILPRMSSSQSAPAGFAQNSEPAKLRVALANAKAALNLTQRPK